MQARIIEPRVTVIEGHRVLVVDRRPPLPQTLAALLAGMRVTFRTTTPIRGTRPACQSEQDHRLHPFVEGRHVGTDAVARDLRLLMCADCESVCVRDISLDTLSRLPTGRLSPRRRDHVIGWYSGARRNQRTYVPMTR